MSFLQLISKHTNKKPVNPAFKQLDHKKIPSKWNSLKSEPKQPVFSQLKQLQSPRRDFLKTRVGSIPKNAISQQGKQRSLASSQSQYASYKRKTESERSNSSNSNLNKKPTLSTGKVQYHHSFSNYLSKKNNLSHHSRLHHKSNFYDLNEIVNKISSPIKLQHKIQMEDEITQVKEKKTLNLSHYQHFLRQMHYDKNRYQKDEFNNLIQRQGQNQYKNRYMDVEVKQIRPRNKTLWLKQITQKKEIKQDKIIPWLEHQQQNSPIKSKHISHTFKIDKINQDFQEFIT